MRTSLNKLNRMNKMQPKIRMKNLVEKILMKIKNAKKKYKMTVTTQRIFSKDFVDSYSHY